MNDVVTATYCAKVGKYRPHPCEGCACRPFVFGTEPGRSASTRKLIDRMVRALMGVF